MKKYLLLILISVAFNAYAGTSLTIGQIADSVTTGQLGGITGMMEAMSYVFGVAFGIKAALKLKEHTESKGQTKIVVPIVFAIAAALFMALPSVFKTGTETFGFDKSTGTSTKTQAGGF